MKANFWQILGAFLLVIGVAGYVIEKSRSAPKTTPDPTGVGPTTTPATMPSTAPSP